MSDPINPDQPLFETPPAGDPPRQDTATDPPAWVGSVVSAIKDGFQTLGSRQDAATSAQAAPVGPASWWDSLNEDQRTKMNEQSLLNPGATNAYMAQQESEFARRRMIQDAAPLIAGQAATFVELYKARKQREKYFEQIEPLFDRMLVGVDLRPLVNMTQAGRDAELEMRWRSAKSEVLDRIVQNPPRPEPNLVSDRSAPAPETFSADTDPLLVAMGTAYNFTEEQKRALEEANKS